MRAYYKSLCNSQILIKVEKLHQPLSSKWGCLRSWHSNSSSVGSWICDLQ